MRHGSLFSGIGGFDLAAEWMGWDNIFHCEWNEFGRKVLNYHFPKSISYEDITKTDFSIHRGKIDILTGGFPCQPYSTAGKRKGKEDDRHLWPEMLRAIREIRPRWVVGENVLGIVNWNNGLVFEEVQTDLETEGYEVQPYVLPAASVNAPHRRDRVWFVLTPTAVQTDESPEKMRARVAKKGYQNGTKYGSLTSQVKYSGMLPTPTAQSSRGNASDNRERGQLTDVIATTHDHNGKPSQLNPRFVAEMMGFPPNWTELPFQNGG